MRMFAWKLFIKLEIESMNVFNSVFLHKCLKVDSISR
jgi:hypothetical protein